MVVQDEDMCQASKVYFCFADYLLREEQDSTFTHYGHFNCSIVNWSSSLVLYNSRVQLGLPVLA